MAQQFKVDRSKLDAVLNMIKQSKAQQASGLGQSIYEGAPAPTNYTAMQTPNDPSMWDRFVDVISRPLYGVQNTIKDLVDPAAGTDNPLESFWAGLSGVDKTTGSDVIQKWSDVTGIQVQPWVKGAGGLVADLGLDPVNYIPLGWVAKPFKAANKALSGSEKYEKAVKAGEGLQEFNRKDAKLSGMSTKRSGVKPAEEQAVKEELAADNAAVANTARKDAIQTEAKVSSVVDPGSNLEDLKDLATPTPSNVGAKTKPIKLIDFDPVTLDFIHREFAQNVATKGAFDTTEEAARAAAEAASKNPKDAANLYRSAFKDHPELGPQIRQEIADSQPLVTPKINEAIKPKPAGFEGSVGDEIPQWWKDAYDKTSRTEAVPGTTLKVTEEGKTLAVPTTGKAVETTSPVVAKKAVVPEAVNITDTGKVAVPKPSQARLANDFEQARRTQELTNRHWRADGPEGEKFTQKMDRVYTYVSDDLRQAKDEAFRAGDYPVVRLDKNDYNLHVSDVLDSLGKDGVRFHLSNYDKVPTSSLLQGAAKAIEGKIGGLAGDDLVKAVSDQIIAANKTRTAVSATRAERVARALISRQDDLERRMVENEARIGKRDLVQGETMGSTVGNEVKATVLNSVADTENVLKAAADVNGTIAREGAKTGMSPGGMAQAANKADEVLSDTLKPTDTMGARETLGAAKDGAKPGKEAKKKVTDRQTRQMKRDEKAVDEDPNARWVDLGEKVGALLDGFVHRLYNGLLGGLTHGFRMGDLAHDYRTAKGFVENVQYEYNGLLRKLSKKYDRDTINGAFVALNSGFKVGERTDIVGKAMADLKPLLSHVYDPNSAVGNILTRQGLDIDTVNALLESKGLRRFQFSTKIKGNKNPTMADVFGEMKDWKVTDDLLDFLSRMQSVGMEASARTTVGVDFARRFGSKTYKPGYVKIAKTSYDRAPMSHFIPDVYVPREYADQMANFSRTIDAKASFAGQKGLFAGFANNVIDPYLRLWKPSVTIFRPGHHVRNFIGDGAMNFMAGVTSPRHYKNALATLRAGGDFKGDIGELEKLFTGKNLPGNDAADILKIRLADGTELGVNPALLYQSAYRNGTMVNYRSAEDILSSEGKNALSRATDRLMETGVARAAGSISQNSTDFHKLAQLSHILSDPKFTSKFNTLDEAVKEANKTIFKFHPDIGGLSKTESKYGRRIVPFYTWMRQAIPTILSASLARPGRLTAYHKATYNAQVAMGMDPESFEEPFDNSGLLPGYIREAVSGNFDTPFGNATFNLGTPAETLNDVFSHGEDPNPVTSVGSFLGESINPLFTALPEVFKQQDISGKHVSDVSENIDQMLPGINQLSSLSGYSLSGTLGNILGGGGDATPMLDPSRQLEQGQKTAFFNQSMINFLTGLGIQRTDTPTAQRVAIRESRS
jgi:hypothetical protein